MRYSQNVKRVLDVPSQSVALLATLMLRGPQTAAELRANSERIHRFADTSSVEGFLDELAEREGASRAAVALAWVLAHPAGVIPIVGTQRLDRIADAATATSVHLSRTDWYALTAAAGRDLP